MKFRSGFAALVGRPNVGKSTLLNALVGRKLAIMSDKPQTTRNRIVGVLNRENAQVIFLDTPGMHKPKHLLGEYLNKVARETIPEVDLVCFVVDGSVPPGEGDAEIAKLIAAAGRPALLVVNKLDRIPRSQLYQVLDQYKALEKIDWVDVIPVSALEHTHLDELVSIIISCLPEGPRYYPEDMVTDQPERFIMAELIREKVLHLTREEVPHSVAVMVEEVTPRENGVVYVRALILVEREGQKGILIGHRGQMIKEIGQRARAEIEALLGSRIYLELYVKVAEDWRNRRAYLRELGYDDRV
ncbi:MAG: GTPase Era [Bacillota bacterium]|nr:MAG: GTPase Era [Bacillota bacterium]